eukprot:TRINITY_DN251_c2_g1_i1.p1 TRINITY_DN251_c2_g1~~TRINITY_DN251_c2_g1_i1.p1  ORF type:complete len:797 (-),score=215.43 TRINITY_DN251_c2_g1_i1:177-2567(-)
MGRRGKKKSGRVADVISPQKKASSKMVESNKQQRRASAVEKRRRKRAEIIEGKRSGGAHNERVVGLFALSPDIDLDILRNQICVFCDASPPESPAQQVSLYCKRWRSHLRLLEAEFGSLDSILDVTSVCDVAIFVADVATGIDDYCDQCLTLMRSQGFPSPVGYIHGLCTLSQKETTKMKSSFIDYFRHEISKEMHIVDNEDISSLLRWVSQVKIQTIHWRNERPHMVASEWSVASPISPAESDGEENNEVIMQISGLLRGVPISANQLVHLSRIGTFQIAQIEDISSGLVIDTPGESQESLVTCMDIDPLAGEQTWPTQEELAEAGVPLVEIKKRKKVPAGFSEYQSSWIVDEEDDEGDYDDGGDDNSIDEEGGVERHEVVGEEEQKNAGIQMDKDCVCCHHHHHHHHHYHVHEDESGHGDMEMDYEREFNENDEDEEEEGVEDEEEEMEEDEEEDEGAGNHVEEKRKLKEMRKKYKDEQDFPDEVDTPEETAARMRFQKYRPLPSFRKSDWDPMENLPVDYSRIFKFENFVRTRKRILREDRSSYPAQPGMHLRISIRISGAIVKSGCFNVFNRSFPLILSALFTHENKVSVVQSKLLRAPYFGDKELPSKSELSFRIGFRHYVTRPLFSELNPRSERQRLERFFHPHRFTLATAFLPIEFLAAPVIVCRKDAHTSHSFLVATGVVHRVDPDRLILKRIVLSGYPIRVKKRHAVVRYMFYNPDDVKWFKPAPLKTKYGLNGHIIESVGTHGYMKCRFDGSLKSHDTVLMPLYKRAFPKWATRYDTLMGEIGLGH